MRESAPAGLGDDAGSVSPKGACRISSNEGHTESG